MGPIVWDYTPEVMTIRRLKQESHQFESSPEYIVRVCLKNKKVGL